MNKYIKKSKTQLVCAITMGDPAGVGPEIIVRALSDSHIRRLARFLVIGDRRVFEKILQMAKLKLSFAVIEDPASVTTYPGTAITLLDVANAGRYILGRASSANGRAALDCIDAGLRLAQDKAVDTLVTAPVDKHAVSANMAQFSGHTEYLADATATKKYVMMLIGGRLRVSLVTRHLALKDVPAALTPEKIYDTIRITAEALKTYFAIPRARIAVCGLNPHCGEKGMMGNEEITLIQPAIKKAARLARVSGPFPADTLFYSALHGHFDAVVAMYHDQGLIPLKMLALHQGVNITLGLPFIRTSPDHGTAYDIAAALKADPGSMKAAIKIAVEMARRKRQLEVARQ
ncbi:MAG: 4-hydroxythreonine-4-phosphate dehydrogenase PdxA [Candidatus Omnitrophota bacterium]